MGKSNKDNTIVRIIKINEYFKQQSDAFERKQKAEKEKKQKAEKKKKKETK